MTRNCLLELEGQLCGWLWFAEGGGATAEVGSSAPDKEGRIKKQLGAVIYEELTLYCGAGMSRYFYDWIKDLCARGAQKRSGSVIYLDNTGREVSRLAFTNAQLVETTFPMVDSAWNEQALLTVKLAPELTRRHRDNAGRPYSLDTGSIPPWMVSHYRLAVAGVAETTARALRIDAVTVQWRKPNGLEVSDLIITYPARAGQAMEAWFEEFVIKGSHGEEHEKAGTLEFYSPDYQTLYFAVNFEGLGICRLDPVMLETGDRTVHLLQARLYCEDLRFDPRVTAA